MSEFRHELKHELGTAELLALRQRLRAVLDPDKHSPDGRYSVRSLYFDDARDTALREKQDGVGSRQKFRLRLYNGDPGFVKLEKKIKRNGLCCKLTEPMRADTVRAVISGSDWTPEGPLSQELKARMASGLLPKTIVDFTREATNFLTGSVSKCSVKSKTVRPDGVELNVEVRMKGESTGFVNALAAIPGVQSAVLVSYNGEYMG